MLKLPDVTCRVPEPHMLEQFALTVQREIAQQSGPDDYPAEALRQRLSGTVYVKLSYGAYADHPRIDVDRSSGWPLLDEFALELAKRSTLQRPEPLRCRSLTVSFPLRFRIAPTSPSQ
jgi:TonB family protein